MNRAVHVYLAHVAWDNETTLRQLQALAATEQRQAERYSHPLRLRSFVASRHLLTSALNELEPNTEDWRFSRHNNRLVLDPQQSHWHVSLSHSQEWVACVLAPTAHCGIDLEQRQANPRYMAIAQRFFHEKEYQWLLAEPEESRFDVFVDIWTRKEACVKAWHCGLAHHLASINFNNTRLEPASYPQDLAECPLTLHHWSSADWQLCAAVNLAQPHWHFKEIPL